MNAVYLISIILGVAAQGIFKKPYTQRHGGRGVYSFCTLTSFVAMLFFVATGGQLTWNAAILPYSLAFAMAYALATVSGVAAIGCGPLSITSLVTSYSLMIPTMYGLIFRKDPIGPGLIPGIVLLAVSLLLISKKNVDAPLTLKWLVYVLLNFVGNGMCSVFQNMQQVAFDGSYKNEFMIAALLIVCLVAGALSLAKERSEIKMYAKSGWHLAMLCGVMNGIVNLFVMILSDRMPVSVIFPLISSGGIIVTYIVSRLYYREKLTRVQLIGFVLGVGAVVFLNL